jgi:hypothetical protein
LDHDSHSHAKGLPLALLLFCVAIQVVALFGLFALVAPAMYHREVASVGVMLGWAVALGIPLSLFEYLFHRYLLHTALVPFL